MHTCAYTIHVGISSPFIYTGSYQFLTEVGFESVSHANKANDLHVSGNLTHVTLFPFLFSLGIIQVVRGLPYITHIHTPYSTILLM